MASPFLKRTALLAALTTCAMVAAMAVVVATSASADAAGAPCQRTYLSDPGVADQPIQDNTTIPTSSTIDVPEDGLVVSDIDVSLNIHHTWDSDLTVELDSFTDASVSRGYMFLITRAGFGEDNFLGTVLDDEAGVPVGWGTAPFTGRFSPSGRLSLLDGQSGGKYTLSVTDDFPDDTGTFNDWSLTLTYATCDFDGDGVEDHSDSCLQISAHTATGCPVTTRTLTAKYRAGKFKGALSSPVAGCKAARSVTIWKVRSGADKRVGTATTRSDGVYKLTRAKHAGRYYATSPRVAVTDQAECPAATSPTFRIR